MFYGSESCMFTSKHKDPYLTWLVEILAPVLVGSKPAELISLPKYDCQLRNKLEKIEKYFGMCQKILYRVFSYKDSSIKVLFYNPTILNFHLTERKNLKFLKSLGYPKEYTLYAYLKCLIDKIEKGSIPDEIGVFLGYPLKDIIGFMGHPSLKLTKVKGWRVYGDPRLSDMKFEEILKSKNKIRGLLNRYSPERVLFLI